MRHDGIRTACECRDDRRDGSCNAFAGKPTQDLGGETVLVTSRHGTREAIDPVRFLGNRSSGKMGYALAEAAKRRGAVVFLVSAPTALTPPAGCGFVPVTSAEEMRVAVMEHLPNATVVIGAAAVADFRMPAVAPGKLRREGALHLDLEPTDDIMRGVAAAHQPGIGFVIAFAARDGSRCCSRPRQVACQRRRCDCAERRVAGRDRLRLRPQRRNISHRGDGGRSSGDVEAGDG